MLLFAQFDEDLIQDHVTEFQSHIGLPGDLSLLCMHKATDNDRNQMVFQLQHESGQTFVLKKDFVPGKPWIEAEFDHFIRLKPHFDSVDHSAGPTPLYLGEDKSFHVCDFIPGRTASEILRDPNAPNQVNQVFRKAGRWLAHLHRFQDSKPEKIWMNWIFKEADNLQSAEGCHARPEHYEPLLSQLEKDASSLQASPCPRVFSHGDFHSGNLILGRGTTYGLDLAYAKEKPLLYDVVDFLLSDINVDLSLDAIGPGGVHKTSLAFFFKTYRTNIPSNLLNFHLRAGLLLRLLKFQTDVVQQKPRQQQEFAEILQRLERAFAQDLKG